MIDQNVLGQFNPGATVGRRVRRRTPGVQGVSDFGALGSADEYAPDPGLPQIFGADAGEHYIACTIEECQAAWDDYMGHRDEEAWAKDKYEECVRNPNCSAEEAASYLSQMQWAKIDAEDAYAAWVLSCPEVLMGVHSSACDNA